MVRQQSLLVGVGVVLLLTLVACAGSALTRGESDTPETTSTATPVLEETTVATPTPTATVVPGGGAGEATPEPTWVPLCPSLELEIEFQQVQSMQMGEVSLRNVINASGCVPLSVDSGVSPQKVSGEGELPVSGGGQAGGCVWQNSGVLAYRFEGEIIQGPDGHPEIHLGGQRSMNIVASASCAGGGSGVPFEDIGEQVLRYEDGHTVEWSWEVPAAGVQGNSKWVLHIVCER